MSPLPPADKYSFGGELGVGQRSRLDERGTKIGRQRQINRFRTDPSFLVEEGMKSVGHTQSWGV